MPRKVQAQLSARAVQTAGPGRYVDGGGLSLLVKRTGARSWVYRGVIRGERRDIGLGPYPEVSLATARTKAMDLRRDILDGRDPISERAKLKANALTFENAAAALIEAKRHEWRNAKHGAQWGSTLRTYAFPVLGSLDVRDIETEHVLKVLRPIWTEKPETASRLRQRIEAVLDYATASRARTGDNPARWRGNLDKLLAKPSKVRRVEHHAALPWREMGAFMADLETRDGMGALALRFAILTAARSGEVRGATWAEIDLDAREWTIPGERMKAGCPHRVPLPDAALAVLDKARVLSCASANGAESAKTAPVFPSQRPGRLLSDMTLAAVLKRMGHADLTVHGFRSTFRDWVSEATAFPGDIAEAALAHTIRNATEAAYRRGDLFEKRRKLMGAWAKHCAQPAPTGDVVPFGREAS